MTALKEYARLESDGIWRESPQADPRDVIVSFGDATLVIAESNGRPLSHWSLAAVQRNNPGTRPAIFTPDAGIDETLTIDDTLMIDAIEKVRKALQEPRPRGSKMRVLSTTVVILGGLAAAAFWGPAYVHEHTLAAVPQSKRAEIGATVLGHMQFLTSPSCRGAQGRQALSALHTRLLGREADGQIVVVPTGFQDAVALPGDIIVVDASIPQSTDDPAITAGYILKATTARNAVDPLAPILADAGLGAKFTLFTTGEVAPELLKDYAKSLIDGNIAKVDPFALGATFADARVPSTPYGGHVNLSHLIDNDPWANKDTPPVLGDGAWVSLQGICET